MSLQLYKNELFEEILEHSDQTTQPKFVDLEKANLIDEKVEAPDENPDNQSNTIEQNITNRIQELENEVGRVRREADEERRLRQEEYERNNPPEEVTYGKIFYRAFQYSLINDLLHLSMLYAYCTLDENARNLLVSKCIMIKLVLWFVQFVSRAVVQPYIDYQRLGQSFRPKDFDQFTISKSKFHIAYHVFTMVVFFFADIYIITEFIPVERSCGAYPLNMCVIQKAYSIICITSYSSIVFFGIMILLAIIAPYFKKYTNEINYALNVAGLQHLKISSDNEDKNCAICFEDMTEATKLPCGHMYHETCINGWLKEKGTCPTCFQPAFNKKTTDLHIYDKTRKYVETSETKNEISDHPANEIV